MYSEKIPNQAQLWNDQHSTRGAILECGELKNIPNQSAVDFSKYLPENSTILEIGAANGRDARYWASLGHRVLALDFSEVALSQLKFLAMEQGVIDLVTPILWDISHGKLPLAGSPGIVNAFYARSALHVGNTAMYDLAFSIDRLLSDGGLIFIEGKGPNDKKIVRSRSVGNGLVVDDIGGGHLRRVWTRDFARRLCDTMRWNVLQLSDKSEKFNGVEATFMNLLAKKSFSYE